MFENSRYKATCDYSLLIYLPSCLGQETEKGPISTLRIKLPPVYNLSNHTKV